MMMTLKTMKCEKDEKGGEKEKRTMFQRKRTKKSGRDTPASRGCFM